MPNWQESMSRDNIQVPGDLSLGAFILILLNCEGTVCPGGQDPRQCMNLSCSKPEACHVAMGDLFLIQLPPFLLPPSLPAHVPS